MIAIIAVAQGFCHDFLSNGSETRSPHHGAYPRLQILTIEGLPDGSERAQVSAMSLGAQTFKTARKEELTTDQKGLF
ncbi:MAG: hypothetical protein ACR2GP_16235 [Burkholderiaceae bacterium]